MVATAKKVSRKEAALDALVPASMRDDLVGDSPFVRFSPLCMQPNLRNFHSREDCKSEQSVMTIVNPHRAAAPFYFLQPRIGKRRCGFIDSFSRLTAHC
jgi:hypothetical protein